MSLRVSRERLQHRADGAAQPRTVRYTSRPSVALACARASQPGGCSCRQPPNRCQPFKRQSSSRGFQCCPTFSPTPRKAGHEKMSMSDPAIHLRRAASPAPQGLVKFGDAPGSGRRCRMFLLAPGASCVRSPAGRTGCRSCGSQVRHTCGAPPWARRPRSSGGSGKAGFPVMRAGSAK